MIIDLTEKNTYEHEATKSKFVFCRSFERVNEIDLIISNRTKKWLNAARYENYYTTDFCAAIYKYNLQRYSAYYRKINK